MCSFYIYAQKGQLLGKKTKDGEEEEEEEEESFSSLLFSSLHLLFRKKNILLKI